jgi:hypothetical protein
MIEKLVLHTLKNNDSSNLFHNQQIPSYLSTNLIQLKITNEKYSTMSIVFSFLYCTIFMIGIFTNTLVVCIFLFKSGSKQWKNSFLINLCIADILVIACCIPIAITDLFSPNVWYYGYLYCKMYFFIEYCVTSASSLTIIFIGIERYLALVSPVTV